MKKSQPTNTKVRTKVRTKARKLTKVSTKTRKKKHGIEEYRIQAKFIEICKAKSATNWRYEWVHSIPYGFRATIGLAIKMKKEGSKNGVADVFVPVPNKLYSGLYLEFKRKYGYQRPEQKKFQKYCEKVGYKYLVVKSVVQALTYLDKYLR